MLSATASPVAPSYQEQKFDRQLRLWGRDGQTALERAHVILLGATSAGCELLKNMVLPNLGSFTIVDSRVVTERHLGSNFFLHADDIGTPIAAAASRCLAELTSNTTTARAEVCGIEPYAQALAARYFSAAESVAGFQSSSTLTHHHVSSSDSGVPDGGVFTAPEVVVCTQMVPESIRVTLSAAMNRLSHAIRVAYGAYVLQPTSPVLMHVETCGLVGVIRIQAGLRFIEQTHPDSDAVVKDLRPFEPFPQLLRWFEDHNPMDSSHFGDDAESLMRHSHIPWPCVVYHAMRLHREALADPSWTPKAPKDYATLRDIIGKRMIRRTTPPEESMREAISECTAALDLSNRLHPRLRRLLEHPKSLRPQATDELCWFLLHALGIFRNRHAGRMPLTGEVPDFTSLSDWYREVKELYAAEANRDAEEMFQLLQEALASSGAACAKHVAPDALRHFIADVCRHSWHLSLVRFTPICDEYTQPLGTHNMRMYSSSSNDESFLQWYAVMRAASRFYEKEGRRFPGDLSGMQLEAHDAAALATDIERLRNILFEDVLSRPRTAASDDEAAVASLLVSSPLTSGDTGLAARVAECVRYGGGEINAVASVVGAAAAQEAIKLIQQRRLPAHDAIVFDGNSCSFGTIVLAS